MYNSYLQTLSHYKTVEDKFKSAQENRRKINRHLIYIQPGITGSSFKYDYGTDSTTIESRFKTRVFNGYKIYLGYTGQFNLLDYVGFSTGLGYHSNLSSLEVTTFNLIKTDTTIHEGQFRTTQEIKAVNGSFDTFLRYDINLDYVHLFSMKTSDNNISDIYISLNPYIRHRIYEKANRLKNNTVLGIGSYAFNSKDNKLAGGLFVQTEDLFGVHTDDDSTIGKRIQFGIVARFGFKGINPK